MGDRERTGSGQARLGFVYPRTSVQRVAVAGVPANEMSFSVTEDSGYQVAAARVEDPEFLCIKQKNKQTDKQTNTHTL